MVEYTSNSSQKTAFNPEFRAITLKCPGFNKTKLQMYNFSRAKIAYVPKYAVYRQLAIFFLLQHAQNTCLVLKQNKTKCKTYANCG